MWKGWQVVLQLYFFEWGVSPAPPFYTWLGFGDHIGKRAAWQYFAYWALKLI